MDPQQKTVAEQFDQYKNSYDDVVNDALEFSGLKVDLFTEFKSAYLIDLITRRFGINSNLNVLDIGCGIGNYHRLIGKQIAKLHGVDVSPACVAQARERNPNVAYDCYDGDHLPYADATFDVCFTICVLHHVPVASRKNFVSEMARVTRPGGLAVMFEHNPWNPLTRYVVNNCEFDVDAVLISMRESRRLFSVQFDSVKTRSILTIPARGKLLSKLDAFVGTLPFGSQYCLEASNTS